MFCSKCGAKNDDNVVFCGQCGAKLNDAPTPAPATTPTQPAVQTNTTTSSDSKKHKIVGITAIVAVVAIAIFLILGLFGKSYTPEEIADKCMTGIIEGDAKEIFDCIHKDVVNDALKDSDMTLQEVYDEFSSIMSESTSSLDSFLGDDWYFSYIISSTETVEESRIESISADYEEYGLKVSEAKDINIELTINDNSFSDSTNVSLRVIKISGKWYLDVNSISRMF